MSEGMLAALAGVAAVFVTLAQWYFSARAASRQRDVEMTQWGHKVIDVIAEIETACFPISDETRYSLGEMEKLSQKASALVDQGRLFFPNVKEDIRRFPFRVSTKWPCVRFSPSQVSSDDDGLRVEILDHVLRACYVARHIAAGGDADRQTLRAQVWHSRGRFVYLLQREMGSSLRQKGYDSAGERVPQDPSLWSPPQRQLKLSPRSEVLDRLQVR